MSETPSAAPDEPQRGFRHIRLVVALAVASLLGTFAVYTAFADTSIPVLGVAQAATGYDGEDVRLEGRVTQAAGDAADPEGLRFTMRDFETNATIDVVYTGSVPDAFRVGREVVIDGKLEGGTLAATPDTLVTKCPSKYEEQKTTADAA
ncbi:MAG: cytochrome c maturation protein CcmE [Gaiellales bacterium]